LLINKKYMNINRNFIIIFGVFTLLIVTIFGIKTYYQEKKDEEDILIEESTNYAEIAFNKNYPVSLEEVDALQKTCADAATFWLPLIQDSIEEPKMKELLCVLTQNQESVDFVDQYGTTFIELRKIPALRQGQYIAIAVNYRDLLEKNNFPISSAENTFNLCTITKPALTEPFREQLLKDYINTNRNIVFSEGEVLCSKFFGIPPETINLLISGFVPKTDLFQAQIYLISEDETVNDIFSQESFTNIEEILQSYHLLWDVEKPII